MENTKQANAPVLWSIVGKYLSQWLREMRVPLTVSAITGLLAYVSVFTNKYMTHDEVYSLFSKGAASESGRWMLNLIDIIFPNLSMPWIYGVITVALIAVSTCLMIDMLKIRSHLLQGMLAGCIVVFPSLISVFSYMFTSSSYATAFFLAVLAVWMLAKQNRWLFLPAIASMVLSLATYQGFVALAAALLLIWLIRQLLKDEKLAAVVQRGVISLLFLILSLGLYYLSVSVVNRYLGIQMNSYASSKIQFSLLDVPVNALTAYENFFAALLDGRHGLVPTGFSRLLHLLCLFSAGGMLLLWFLEQKRADWGRYILLLILVALLPLAIACMYLFTSVDAIHTLVLYSFVAVYVLAAVLADLHMDSLPSSRIKAMVSHVCSHLLPGCMALIIVVNIYIANAAYLNLHLRYEIAYSFYTSLVADIKMMPEFTEDTKLAVIGYYEEPEFYQQNFGALDEIMGVRGFRPSSYSKDRFLLYYLDFDIPMASEDEIAQIQQTSEFQEMPLYPYYGSMKMIGDTLVVKLS